MEEFLSDVSKQVKHRNLPESVYYECKEHIAESVTSSTRFYFDQNPFFQDMPPRMKSRLVRSVLTEPWNAFSFFFEDFQERNGAPEAFMVKVLTQLVSVLYKPGEIIIPHLKKVDELIVIMKGSCNLYGFNDYNDEASNQ